MSGYDVIVIGAGHNGLVCAAYLAKAGMKVLVVERSPHVGGGCVTQELRPGYRFSTFAYGAHGPGPRICADLGIPEEAFVVKSPDPSGVQLFSDGDRVVLWRDPSRTEEELARFGKNEVAGFRRYQEFCRRAVRICAGSFLTAPPSVEELHRIWSSAEDAAVLKILLEGSLWDAITDCFANEKVRMAFARADDAGPCHHPGSALAEFMESASTGLGVQNASGILEHGMGRITQVLADRVRAHGGDIRVNAPVKCVRIETAKAVGVELESGEVIASRHVASNADPKRTFLKLVEARHLGAEFRRSVEAITTRAGYMKFFATLNDFPRFKALRPEERNDPRFAAVPRILPSNEYAEASWRDSAEGRLPRNPILSLQVPTVYWPSQAPEGKHIFGAWVRWAPARLADGSAWDARREEMADRIVEIVEECAPGFRRMVEWHRLFTPSDIERETGMTDACIRHADMTLDQMLRKRPLPGWCDYRTPIGGLWMCGSGVHPCGAVTGGPGHNCAAAILRG